MTPEEEAALTPETIAERVVGSKWVLVVEEAMVLTVWTCKLGMLFLYRRITYVNPPPTCPVIALDLPPLQRRTSY